MAITICRNCGKIVSTDANFCSKCGVPNHEYAPIEEYQYIVMHINEFEPSIRTRLEARLSDLEECEDVKVMLKKQKELAEIQLRQLEDAKNAELAELKKKMRKKDAIWLIATGVIIFVPILACFVYFSFGAFMPSQPEAIDSVAILAKEKEDARLDSIRRVEERNNDIAFMNNLGTKHSFKTIEDTKEFFDVVKRASAICTYEEDNSLSQKFNSKLIAFQTNNFPKARQFYSKYLGNSVKDQNISVYVSGTTVTFTSDIFIVETNVKLAHEATVDLMKKFRFKKAVYRSPYAGYSYSFNIDSPNDKDIEYDLL